MNLSAVLDIFGESPPIHGEPTWTLTGGVACNIHLSRGNLSDLIRSTKDFDLFSFTPHLSGEKLPRWSVFYSKDGCAQNLPLDCPPPMNSTCVDIWRDFHFDNIIPTLDDVDIVEVNGKMIPILKVEFLMAFKAFSSFWSRDKDQSDAENLFKSCDLDGEYLDSLMRRGPLSKYIEEADSAIDKFGCREKIDELGRRVFEGFKNSSLLPIFEGLPCKAGMALSLFPIENMEKIDRGLLRDCVKEDRMNVLTEGEQEFALLLISANTPNARRDHLIEVMDHLYGATVKKGNYFDRNLFFSLSTLWGRYMHPVYSHPLGKKFKFLFQQTHTSGRFMVYCGEYFGLGSPMQRR